MIHLQTNQNQQMKHQIKLYLCALIALFTISCSRKSTVSKTDTVTIFRDSIYEKETVKLDTVIIPGDTLQTTFTIECDSLTNKPKPAKFQSNSKRLTQSIVVEKNGQILSKCIADSLIHVLASVNKELTIYKALAYTKSNSESTVIEKIKIPKWVWYLLTANILYFLWRVRKPVMRLFFYHN